MDEQTSAESAGDEQQPQWRPLNSRQRRVIGVLVEKAKTTPDAYPLSLNAVTTGCNQKSNRSPQMNLTADDVEETLDELRGMGAVAEVQSGGRVAKYRHYMYDWLGVDKYEIAVVAELLLRGEQTVGELRGRAARMAPIADLAALRPVLQSLIEKRLVVALSPEGRGQIVTHGLHAGDELDRIRSRIGAGPAPASPQVSQPPAAAAASSAASASPSQADAELRDELDQLRSELDDLRQRVQKLEQMVE